MKNKLLGIDIGTSSCKAAVFDAEGTVLSSASESYPVLKPHVNWAEQDVESWWKAVCDTVHSCLDTVDAEEIAAVGVDGQSWSCIPVDGSGKVLMSDPIWMDSRAEDICRKVLNETVPEEKIFELSGNPFSANYTTGKIIWLKEQKPDIYRKTKWILQSNSFIVYRLTGSITQDYSQCYGIHVYDAYGKPDEKMSDLLGIDLEKLPRVFESHHIAGTVTKEAGLLTGLRPGTPVVAGGLDAACAALGCGVYSAGMTQEQGGQAGGMSICTDKPVKRKNLIFGHAVVPGKWLLQGGTISGSASLKWIAGEIGQAEAEKAKENGTDIFTEISALAGTASCGSGGVVFLPYLSGERSPIWDTEACGMLFGLSFRTKRAEIYRSVMEGTAFALRHNLETAEQGGIEPGIMYSVGGASRSSVWMQIKADVTGETLCTVQNEEATALGAAMLAGVGIGIWKDFETAVRETVKVSATYSPDEKRSAVYDGFYRIYRDLYLETKETMKLRYRLLKENEGGN